MSTIQLYDASVDILTSLLWQSNQAVNLTALLQAKQDWYDENHVEFWNNWCVDVFDLRTANEFGLSVWAVILDLPLFGDDEVSPTDYPAFGFGNITGTPSSSPIQNFYDPGTSGSVGGNFATDARGAFGIDVEKKRILLRLRYFQLVTRGTQLEVNTFLNYLFGPNQIYMLDGLDMTITYVFLGALARSMQSLFEIFDVLPRLTGVEVNFVDAELIAFGFAPPNTNFDNGSFIE